MTVLTKTQHELVKINGLEKSEIFLQDAGASLAEGAGETIVGDLTVSDREGTTLRDLTVTGTLTLASPDVLVENCRAGNIRITANGCAVRSSTVEGQIAADGVENLLVALCVVREITLTDAHNSVCLLNRAQTISAKNGKSIYICENDVRSLSLASCRYLVVNGNAEGAEIKTADITAFVGNNLTDINAREKCGANEALLPQVNKDTFLFMPRRQAVHEEKNRGAVQYLEEEARTNRYIILAPGVYSVNATINFENLPEGCVIYAYGVLLEKDGYETGSIRIISANDFVIKGLQIDHTMNSTAQGIVIGKLPGQRLRIMASAGMYSDWSDPRYYAGGTLYHYHAGHPEFSTDGIATRGFTYDAINNEVLCTVPSTAIYDTISVGDTVAARGKGSTGIQVSFSRDTYLEDVTQYGSAGFAYNESACHTQTVLHRVWDTTGPPAIINEATYERYKAYERLYGVSFSMSEETDPAGERIYRGTPPICSSVDATHTSRSKIGTACVSCLFESMCDDGTNQTAMHGRLHGYRDNGDGTVTVLFKNNVSTIGLIHKWHSGSCCAQFEEGERVYIYTSVGKLICDTPALTASREATPYKNGYDKDIFIYEVEVAKDAFDAAACDSYEMESDVAGAPKILIDNMSRASNGFVFDNMLIRYVRSRGLLIKASNGIARNCSFYKCGKGCMSILFEIQWGESGVSEHLDIRNNYFEGTGYIDNLPAYSPIAVEGLGTRASDEYLLYHDIVFEGNVMRNRGGTYAVYLNSARQVKLLNNDFGTRAGETAENPQPSVYINCAKDVELSGNTYSPYLSDITECVTVKGNRNVYGNDAGEKLQNEPEMFPGMRKTDPLLHPPKLRKDSTFDYAAGAWSAGFSPIDTLAYETYIYMNGGGWFASDPFKSGEGNTGGIDSKNCLHAPQYGYNVGYAYTAEESGEAYLGLETLTAGRSSSLISVFVNEKMVWPTEGGAYEKGEDWASFDQDTNLTRLAASLASKPVTLTKGDRVFFIARVGKHAGSYFKLHPVVAWKK